MKKLTINNNLTLIYKYAPNTARVALTGFVDIAQQEKTPGCYTMLNRLFMQGTKTRTAELLADEIEKTALELYSEMRSDYWKFSGLCLKEDLEKAVELMADIMLNSTLEEFDKELVKMEGEYTATLDSPSSKARAGFVGKLYEGHQYGHTEVTILENIEKLTVEEVRSAYKNIFLPAHKVFAVVGDVTEKEISSLLEKYFTNLKTEKSESSMGTPIISGPQIVKIEKEDAQQAQIFQGWLVPNGKSQDAPALTLLNTILGASGLSSRLFLELRDKKGLAYTVRSMYNKSREIGDFRVYIGTEPKNILTSIEGFKVEINKLKQNIVSNEELEAAKNNYIGKIQFVTETNQQQSASLAFDEFDGLGYDYMETRLKKIMEVTPEEVRDVACKYLNDNYVLTILAPKKFLDEV